MTGDLALGRGGESFEPIDPPLRTPMGKLIRPPVDPRGGSSHTPGGAKGRNPDTLIVTFHVMASVINGIIKFPQTSVGGQCYNYLCVDDNQAGILTLYQKTQLSNGRGFVYLCLDIVPSSYHCFG